MAKVTGPLMSIDASGAFADTKVYDKWNGEVNYNKQYGVSRMLSSSAGRTRTCNLVVTRTPRISSGLGLSLHPRQ
jgi:hypothetical protein